YSLFTIPNKNDWTVILNKEYDQWGAFKYNKEEDFFRFKVTPQKNDFVERLKICINYKEPYISEVCIMWEKLKISFAVKSNSNQNK
ncbi:MAG: DUF2911 domain-containing protein, partial [Ignavibacteriae bacterium]|nr:DUF2911 domain-containing protein [Ignavibacteriota bacterium]